MVELPYHVQPVVTEFDIYFVYFYKRGEEFAAVVAGTDNVSHDAGSWPTIEEADHGARMLIADLDGTNVKADSLNRGEEGQGAVMPNAQMPPGLAELWKPLYDEVVWLHARWKIYRQLYATSPERIDLLNRSAPAFFHLVNRVFGDEIQLALSKLADPALSRKKRNLTLETLLIEVRGSGELALINKLEAHLANVRRNRKIINRRNRYIAHHDLQTLLNGDAKAAPSASRKEISEALDSVAKFMNTIELHFTHSSTAFDAFSFRGDDAEALLDLIRQGLLYRELETSSL